MWRIIATTGELVDGDWRPVLEHHFLGDTLEDALAIYVAHRKADAFFRGCGDEGSFDGITCRTIVRVRRG